MDDNDVPDRTPPEDGEMEELSVGDWHDAPGHGPGHRWRSRIGLLLAFCLVFCVGAAGMYGWQHRRQRHRPRIEATLSQTQRSQARQTNRVPAGLQLHNHGRHPVTIEKVRLSRSGFTVSSGGLRGEERLASHETTEISYQLSPDCDGKVKGPATVRVRVRMPGGTTQWITDTVPQDPPDVIGFGLTASQFERCSQVRGLELTTRHASQSADMLTLHVRLKVEADYAGSDDPPPKGVRLHNLSVGGEAESLQVSFTPAGSSSDEHPRLPVRGALHLQAKRTECYAPAEPVSLNASVTTSGGHSGHASIDYDTKSAARILGFTAKRCG